LKIFILSLFIVANLFALEENQIKPFMQSNINEAVQIIKHGNENNTSREIISEKIFQLFDKIFDYKLMARLSLGSATWRSLSSVEQKEFTAKFTTRLKTSYKTKLDKYNNQKITIDAIDKIKANRIHLLTQIKGDKEKFDVTYKFYKAAHNQWYIYDIDVLGVSIIQTYRSQFSDELKKHSFNELLAKLSNIKN